MATQKSKKETPLMQQYNQIKGQHPDAILLFRVGDFYETFGEDAILVAKILDIVLTKRANGAASHIELAGFPHHALDNYLPRLVEAGYRVAVCDQLELPSKEKKIVKRGVTEIVTPGVTLSDRVLRAKTHNYLAAISKEKDQYGIAFIEVSTGDFFCSSGDEILIKKWVHSFKPSEIVVNKTQKTELSTVLDQSIYTYGIDDWVYNMSNVESLLLKHFAVNSLRGFGFDKIGLDLIAAGAALQYVYTNQQENVPQISSIQKLESEQYVWIDPFTYTNLELLNAAQKGGKSLVDILDKTVTPMGARMLRHWVALPLKDIQRINKRLDLVEMYYHDHSLREQLEDVLKRVGDLERLVTKIATARINPHEYNILANTLLAIQDIQTLEGQVNEHLWKEVLNSFNDHQDCILSIQRHIHPEAPAVVSKGSIMAEGVSEELDELRTVSMSSKQILDTLCETEKENAQIPSLKIGFNNVFGYYFEVRNTHKDKIPEHWTRKQTLVSSERYISPELKELEQKILTAEDRIATLEQELFQSFVQASSQFIDKIQEDAKRVAQQDILHSWATLAVLQYYTRPVIGEQEELEIFQGRHPVIEQILGEDTPYISNDMLLDKESKQIAVISGPNMSGKSAYLRQNALIIIMAQIGSFVPADKAKIGLVDRVFSRVGASDNLSTGESTFMVEMNETANIMNNISSQSFILLDEIGRGTSTYDGISIAWSMIEYLEKHPYKPKTLFATHYHELADLESKLTGVHNLTVDILENKGEVKFLRKIKRGSSQKSFGINVAKIAGMPSTILDRAERILNDLETNHSSEPHATTKRKEYQVKLFDVTDRALEQLRDEVLDIDVNAISPLEALMKISELQKTLKKVKQKV